MLPAETGPSDSLPRRVRDVPRPEMLCGSGPLRRVLTTALLEVRLFKLIISPNTAHLEARWPLLPCHPFASSQYLMMPRTKAVIEFVRSTTTTGGTVRLKTSLITKPAHDPGRKLTYLRPYSETVAPENITGRRAHKSDVSLYCAWSTLLFSSGRAYSSRARKSYECPYRY